MDVRTCLAPPLCLPKRFEWQSYPSQLLPLAPLPLHRPRPRPSRGLSDDWSDYEDQDGQTRPPKGLNLARRNIVQLTDTRLSVQGDLGWNIGYATAHCFRFLVGNRFPIVEAVNDARRLPVKIETPYAIFDTLDKHCFEAKLSGAVLLTWKPLGSGHLGITHAQSQHAKRINIQLNSTPFEREQGDIDLLLEMLIHHMIHAYFLVCCGAQKNGEKQDGRLHDGLQFGVISSTLNDITMQCQDGSLRMTFHAVERCRGRSRPQGRGKFVSLDPEGMSLPVPVADGHSHCMHDNRNITRAQITSWQVEAYAKAIAEDWQTRSDEIYFWIDGRHRKMKRMEGPPSRFYCELIWDGKRFAVPRVRANRFSALTKLTNDNKFGDMKLPNCSAEVFDCLWMFVTSGGYGEPSPRGRMAGPPVLLSPHSRQGASTKLHIQVCKLADQMSFKELQQFAIRRLYEIGGTCDDPIAMLRDIYDPTKSLSVDLQSWTRKFLARGEGASGYDMCASYGLSNYEKIIQWHEDRFTKLYTQHAALRDDCIYVVAGLKAGLDPNVACPPETVVPPENDEHKDAASMEDVKQLRMLDLDSTARRRDKNYYGI